MLRMAGDQAEADYQYESIASPASAARSNIAESGHRTDGSAMRPRSRPSSHHRIWEPELPAALRERCERAIPPRPTHGHAVDATGRARRLSLKFRRYRGGLVSASKRVTYKYLSYAWLTVTCESAQLCPQESSPQVASLTRYIRGDLLS